ncbi:MAG: DUF1152 domain-containing protein [Solirubrobacteraceae bacterium]
MAADAEAILRAARRPLVLGIGGGGDVVGALATAEGMRLYDGADPLVGGISWERRPIDPVPGPRRVDEITGGWQLAPGIVLAGPDTRVRDRPVRFAESGMAAFLNRPTLLVTIDAGPAAVAESLAAAARALRRDLIVLVDVGGDVLAQGDEPGLRSPLCDAIMLAVAGRLAAAGWPVLLGIFGIGCDSELTNAEVLERIAAVARAGGLCGARGLTEPVAQRLEQSLALVVTEASAQAVRAFRGDSGMVTIREGTRRLELITVAAQTLFLDVPAALQAVGRLARAVADAPSLELANEALHEIGVRTELDLERAAAAEPPEAGAEPLR